MARIEKDLQTALPPDRVVAALTDFSDRRGEIWPLLDASQFKVLETGETSALVREGSSKPFRVSAVERYDWSVPGVVRWTVQESDSFMPGYGMEVRVTPAAAGGSTVHVVWERVGKDFKGKFIVGLLVLLRARPIFSGFQTAFDRIAES
jgi:Polyketide cyclase / dehydrase and lipid transport